MPAPLGMVVGDEVGVEVGDEVGDAVLKIAYAVLADSQSVLPEVCSSKSKAPVAIDSFNACINSAVAVLVSLKMRVGVITLYISSVSTAAATRERDPLGEAGSLTCWIVMSSSLQS